MQRHASIQEVAIGIANISHQLKQLPGIAVQRLMFEGYGFGAEGDWKTAALVRILKVMSQ